MKRELLFALTVLFAHCADTSAQENTLRDLQAESRVVTRIPPPTSRILDFDDIFANDPAALRELSEGLIRLSDKYDYSIYFIIYSGLIGSDVANRAADFRDHWLRPHDEGLVIVFDTGSKHLAYALSRSSAKAESALILPDHRTLQAIGLMMPRGDLALSELETVREMGSKLVAEFEKQLAIEAAEKPRTSKTFLAIFAIAAALSVTIIWVAQLRARKRKIRQEAVSFPAIETPPRLGAKFAGGIVGEVTFKDPNPPS